MGNRLETIQAERMVAHMTNTAVNTGKSAGTVNFSMRIPSDKIASLECLYNSLGMTLSEAVNAFFEKSLTTGTIPFDTQPTYSRETLAAAKEALDIEAGRIPAKRYQTVEELFADNDAEELTLTLSRTGSHSTVLGI